jgi:hypothetical protein
MGEIPGTSLVKKVFRHECTDRADVHYVSVPICSVEPFLEERVDYRTVTALYNRQSMILLYFTHEAHAARAHHASITVKKNITTEIISAKDSLWLYAPTLFSPLCVDIILQVAFPRHITDWTVEWVIHQIELKDPASVLKGLIRLCVNHLPVHNRGYTTGHRLRRSLNLNQAKPAHRRRRHSWMIAVVGDLRPDPLGRF